MSRCSGGTRSAAKDCNAGCTTITAVPPTATSARMATGLRPPPAQSPASPNVATAATAWASRSWLRWLKRSASDPLIGFSTIEGRIWATTARPTHTPEPVSWNSTYGTVMFCIQVPMFDTTAPVKNSR